MQLPGRAEKTLDGTTQQLTATEGMIEVDQEPMESRSWLIARPWCEKRGRVRVINVLLEPVNINAGTDIAVLQPLDKITVVPTQQSTGKGRDDSG